MRRAAFLALPSRRTHPRDAAAVRLSDHLRSGPDGEFATAGSTARVRGFSLIELIVVLAIVVILTSLLMPGLRSVRESANRLNCASNLRQIGYGITCYARDYGDFLPYSYFGSQGAKMPGEMMAITTGGSEGTFEGLGRLLPRAGCYIDCADCLYCPSHRGEHQVDRYVDALRKPSGAERAFGNYHYRGDASLDTGQRYRLDNDHAFVLVTDGLRTKSDFNHTVGMNILHGDLAVTWFADVDGALLGALPEAPTEYASGSLFDTLWDSLADGAK